MEITTVRRNTKRHKLALQNAHDIKRYTLDNGFIGQDVDPGSFREYVFGRQVGMLTGGGHGPKLTEHAGRYTLHFHSNFWYEFSA